MSRLTGDELLSGEKFQFSQKGTVLKLNFMSHVYRKNCLAKGVEAQNLIIFASKQFLQKLYKHKLRRKRFFENSPISPFDMCLKVFKEQQKHSHILMHHPFN